MIARKLAVVVIIALALAAFFALDLGQYLSLAALKVRHAEFAAFRESNPWLAGGAYFLVYVLVTALSLPGAACGGFVRPVGLAMPEECPGWQVG